jgi:diacylglycerol kinase (ATP)
MPLRKPKYTLWDNAGYAISGLIEVTKHERSFKLQILLFVVMNVIAWSLPIPFVYAAGLSVSLFIPIMAELANSAVERVVDLVTHEYHELAKRAKDAGAALVFVSLLFTGSVWIVILIAAFNLVG